MQSKKCVRCGEVKSFSMFYKSKISKDGVRSYCKACCIKINLSSPNRKEVSKRTRAKHREKRNEWARNRRASDPDFRKREIIYKKKRVNDLTDSYICMLLGLPFNERNKYSELLELRRNSIRGKRILKEL